MEDSFREDAIILFQQLAITNTVLITRVYIFLDGKKNEKERKAFEEAGERNFQRELFLSCWKFIIEDGNRFGGMNGA